jgi:hypothetical protein
LDFDCSTVRAAKQLPNWLLTAMMNFRRLSRACLLTAKSP